MIKLAQRVFRVDKRNFLADDLAEFLDIVSRQAESEVLLDDGALFLRLFVEFSEFLIFFI